jgi:two-component system, sensor histidine kinase and response regulator
MARISRLTQFSSVAVLCFIFASAVYMMYLVYSQYQVREQLQRSSLERHLQENEKRALAVGYFISERQYDLSTLLESRELSLYYENQALGMSLEYGLGASMNAVRELLNDFRGKRLMDGKPLFSRLAYQEASGKTLFESSDREIVGEYRERLPQRRFQGETRADFFHQKIGKDEYIVISFPFRFKGRYTGQLSGWIPVELICRHFVETAKGEKSQLILMVFQDRYLFGNHDVRDIIPPASLPDLSRMKPGALQTITLPSGKGVSESVHAFLTPVAGTPIALASFYRSGPEGSGAPPRGLMYILGGIGLALLVGGIAFYRLSMRSVALEVRLEETQLREVIVEESNNNLRKLLIALEQSPNSVIITDVSGTIEYVNPHFCRVTGYDAEEVLGKSPGILKSGETPPEKYRDMWETVLSGRCWSGEFRNRKKSGELYWEQSNIAPVMDEQGVITSLIAIKEDITERKRAELEQREAKVAAEAASRAKSAFLANMSHEIRTPMNGIVGMTDLCLSTDLDGQQRLYLTAVRESAENLMTIINDILDFSKIEAGKIEIEEVPFLLRTMVGQALRTLAPRAAERGLEVIFSPSPGTPDLLLGDPGRLKQVIINLVGNAVKFSENGQVLVEVSVAEEDDNGYLLSFSVRDSGIGIMRERLESIFEAFEQGDLSTTKVYGGTGLGLTISRKLVELMGGTIMVNSEEGKGSTFTFTARFRRNNYVEQVLPRISLKHRRALVVDDSAINRRVLSEFLESWGVIPYQVENAAHALDFLRQSVLDSLSLDFLLIDAHMPLCDGWQLVSEIRSNPVFNSARCILMPSVGMMGDSRRCRDLGIDGYLTKPIVHSELQEMLCALASPVDSPSHPGKYPVTRHTVLENRGRLSVLIAEDVTINQEIMRAILARYGHGVTMVNNGAEAVEKWENNRYGYDLILMDVQMPVMDGLQATGRIRELERAGNTHIPIVAITAYAMKGDRDRILAAGMDDYLSKPFKSEDVVALLTRYGAGSSSADVPKVADAAGKKGIKPHGKHNVEAVFNRTGLLARIGGREEMVQKLVALFVSLVEKTLPELEKAIAEEDREGVRREMHTLGGAAANIGAERVHQLVTALNGRTKRGEVEHLAHGLENLRTEFEQFKSAVCLAPDGGC